MDCVIKNGTIVTAEHVVKADIGIQGEKIAAIEPGLEGETIIDASGQYVFPGFIDPHVHLLMAIGNLVSSDDFTTGTIAAACGGTTTVIDFTENYRGDDLLEGTLKRRAQADGKVAVDYSLHLTLADATERTLAQLPLLAKEGYASAKLYTTYEGLWLQDAEILRLLAATRDCGILPMIHTENNDAIAYLTAELLRKGKTAPKYHPMSRPPLVEAEAANRVTVLAQLVDAPLYIAHLTCHETLDRVQAARQRKQQVYAETCPQYLLLSQEDYERPGFEGAKFVLSPPLRDKSNWDVLWSALANGELQVVSTDHCPWYYETQKVLGRDSFAKIPNGAPGIETRVPLLFSEGVGKGRLSLQRFVEVCATAPARLFGLYPRKGTVAVGSDADLVIYDPGKKVTLSYKTLHQRADYCPYEGHVVRGYPRTVLLRGQVIVEDGQFVGRAGQGQFIPRRAFAFQS
ncbi:MAG: dihydropyrimidinase [Chloroflexi bacterium]|nr:dihydropyrimidinase [Chloroflexota bacterium]